MLAKAVDQIKKYIYQLDRPNLLLMLGLQFDRSSIDDIEGFHPVTLYQKSTLCIESFKVPFLHKETAG